MLPDDKTEQNICANTIKYIFNLHLDKYQSVGIKKKC